MGWVGVGILAAHVHEQLADYPVGGSTALEGFYGSLMANLQKVGLLLEKTFFGTRNHRMLVKVV